MGTRSRASFGAIFAATLAILGSLPGSAWARPIQIIHTNDLHSHFEHADDPHEGGYAAIKATIDTLRAEASAQGIESLVLDAGDFSEGSPLFFAGDGRDSWQIIENMGYDAVAIGNHDWLTGVDLMETIAGSLSGPTNFVSANFSIPEIFVNLKNAILPAREFRRAGLNIAVLGLSTDEKEYRWRVTEGGSGADVTQPIETAAEWVPELRQRDDAVIALTHLGVDTDQDLVREVPGIDLVVGGHSHTELHAPIWQADRAGVRVPIVQTGAHGRYVGNLLVDIEPHQPLQVLRYELVPVRSDGAQDPEIKSQVSTVRASFDSKFGRDWLGEVIGFSNVPLEAPENDATTWSYLVTDAFRDTAGTDAAVESATFFGTDLLPAGPVTRETLMWYYPRTFDPVHKRGWNVWSIRAQGWMIKKLFRETYSRGHAIVCSGLTFSHGVDPEDGEELTDFRIAGKKLRALKYYRIAVPEAIARGSLHEGWWAGAFFAPKDTGVSIWQSIENRLRKVGGVVGR